MIVINPIPHRVKSANFRTPFWSLTTLVSVTFFWVLLDEVQPTVESYWSREVGLHKVPLVF